MSLRIKQLTYYPVKGCRGIDLQTAQLKRTGIALDRSLMIIDPKGRFVSQRERPKMARIQPSIANGVLSLAAEGMETISLPIRDDDDDETLDVEVWGDVCKGVLQSKEADVWLGDFFHAPLRLVAMRRDFRRALDPDYALSPLDSTAFADGFPLLLVSEASLRDLNARLARQGKEPVEMNRFRPNIVVGGDNGGNDSGEAGGDIDKIPFAEDAWRRVRTGSGATPIEIALVKPCARCSVPTVNQTLGVAQGNEPIATLKTFRRSADGAKILFGQNCIPLGEGLLAVGDVVEILERNGAY
jgi:uncharacterized protein YcbX